MNAKHRETLRNLQTLMGHVDPDSWFISPALPNRDVREMLDAVEAALDEGQYHLARLQSLESAVEQMAPLAKVEELERAKERLKGMLDDLQARQHDQFAAILAEIRRIDGQQVERQGQQDATPTEKPPT